MLIVWIVSIILTLVVAAEKRQGVVGLFFLSILTGPLAVIIAFCLPSRKVQHVSIPQNLSTQEAHTELQFIKESLAHLQARVIKLEGVLKNEGVAVPTEPIKPIVTSAPVSQPNVNLNRPEILPASQAREIYKKERVGDTESILGKYWLNKIGIVIFTLGIGFLISYTFKSFGPFLKIALGYTIAAVLFYAGVKWEKNERLVNFGRALLGGAWAIIYFTTYAMHHFAASRIIESQTVDLLLLGVVVAGMITHALKYKSEEVFSLALFVAYITATMGPITYFTVVSLMLLALVILVLVYKYQWVKSFALGVVLTYVVHAMWIMPKIFSYTRAYQEMNLTFLTSYAIVFFLGAHLAKTVKEQRPMEMLAAVNFGNSAIYAIFAVPIIQQLFAAQKFWVVLGMGFLYLGAGIWMKAAGNRKMFVSDIVTGFCCITFALLWKFQTLTTTLLWLVEIPFLLFIGLTFKERLYRFLAYALTFVVGWRLLFWQSLRTANETAMIFGMQWTTFDILLLWAGVSMAVSFYLLRKEKSIADSEIDQSFDHIFPAASCGAFTVLVFSLFHSPWLSPVLAGEALTLLALNLVLPLRRIRIYAYLLLIFMGISFMTDLPLHLLGGWKWFIVSINLLACYLFYFTVKYLKQSKRMETAYDYEEDLCFWLGIVLLVVAAFKYIDSSWLSLNLGLAGILYIVIGFISRDKLFRLGGMGLLALTLCKVIAVDLADLDVIFKIITFIILGALLVGVSYIYNRFNIGQEKEKR